MVESEVEKRLWAAADQLWANTGLNLRARRDLLLPKLVSGELDLNRTETELGAAE